MLALQKVRWTFANFTPTLESFFHLMRMNIKSEVLSLVLLKANIRLLRVNTNILAH